MTTVALLGTGTMGAGMARNIAAAGHTVRVWNRTRSRADALADVAAVCDEVSEAVDGADVVVTMLWDVDTVEETLRSSASYTPGAVLLQTSTVGVEGAYRLADVADDLGLRYVDAPVLGTKQPADTGALVVLASGPDDLRDVVTPVLDAIGSRTIWVGEAGSGQRLKLAANAFVITLLGGVAQSLALARDLGLDPRLFLEAISGGAMDAPYVRTKGEGMLSGDYTPSFSLAGAFKDADLIVEAARSAGIDSGLIEAARAQQARAVEAGHGDDDMAVVFRVHDGAVRD